MTVQTASPGLLRSTMILFAAGLVLVVGGLAIVPMSIIGGGSLVFAAGGNCPSGSTAGPAATATGTPTGPAGTATRRKPGSTPSGTPTAAGSPSAASTGGTVNTVAQPGTSAAGRGGIPADYLALYQQMGRKYGVPWVILAGIGKVESNHGQTTLPGVHSGQNGFGAAGPMQIGIMGASGNTWGGAPVHPASELVNGVATDGNGDGIASVYDPADAIAGAARYLLRAGVLTNVSGAIFAYNHLQSYVQAVLYWAGVYASGGFVVTTAGAVTAPQCLTTATTLAAGGMAATQAVNTAIGFARQQLGKPYQWGGAGPDAFDCSGLVMMAYRSVGISIPRTSQAQWTWGPRISAGQVQAGDLVFFAGSDGTMTSPGHVGIVIGHGLMIEAYATGFPIRIAPYNRPDLVGFTRPWAHSGVNLPKPTGQPTVSSPPVPTAVPTGTGLPSPTGFPSPTGLPSPPGTGTPSSPGSASPGTSSPTASP
jgi:peptidoglycan DL-endopeptidase CwlO